MIRGVLGGQVGGGRGRCGQRRRRAGDLNDQRESNRQQNISLSSFIYYIIYRLFPHNSFARNWAASATISGVHACPTPFCTTTFFTPDPPTTSPPTNFSLATHGTNVSSAPERTSIFFPKNGFVCSSEV